MPDMLVKLYDLPALEPCLAPLREQGVTLRHAMPYEKYQVVDWVRGVFSPGWAGECDVSFAHQPVACYVATREGRLLGFGCYDSTCKGFFGPTGVLEEERGQGIGRALLLSCLHAMAAAGYAYAIVGGVGPKEFYAKVVGAVEIEGSTPGIYRDPLHPADG